MCASAFFFRLCEKHFVALFDGTNLIWDSVKCGRGGGGGGGGWLNLNMAEPESQLLIQRLKENKLFKMAFAVTGIMSTLLIYGILQVNMPSSCCLFLYWMRFKDKRNLRMFTETNLSTYSFRILFWWFGVWRIHSFID